MRLPQTCAMRPIVTAARARRRPILTALFALVVGLFTLGSLTDAAACGPEQAEATVHSLIDAAPSADADADADCCTGAHGCAHGHCHAPAGLPPGVSAQTDVWTTTAHLGASPQISLASTAPDGLIRPPRA